MMDEDEIRAEMQRLFYMMIADFRPEKHAAARQNLLSLDDEEGRKLAEAGDAIYNAIYGNGPVSSLEDAVRIFGEFTETSFWHGFMEAGGQVLLEKAVRGNFPQEKKEAFFEKGLILVSKAAAPGFGLSDATVGLVSEGKKAFPQKAALAERILRMHGHGEQGPAFKETPKPKIPKPKIQKRARQKRPRA
jgi:hypothetical protein